MERFVLEGRKLNGPPAAREVNATLKHRGLEDEYVQHACLFIVIAICRHCSRWIDCADEGSDTLVVTSLH